MNYNENTGPITRLRAKTMKSWKKLADRYFENSQQTTAVNQNDKRLKRKRNYAESLESECIASETVTTSNLNLMDILDNWLCRNHVLSFLQVGDLLRLRRVCRSTKEMSEDFIRMYKVSTQQPLKISFQNNAPFREFNQFQNASNPLPTRANLQVTFCDRPPILNSMCTNNVTHLTVLNLQLPFVKKSTLNFLDSFPNVTHLVLDDVQIVNGYVNQPAIPETFRKLKSLKILDSNSSGMPFGSHGAFNSFKLLLRTCVPSLEFISVPCHKWVPNHAGWPEDVIELVCSLFFSNPTLKIEGMSGSLMRELLKTEGRIPEMRGRHEMIENINAKVVSIYKPESEVFLQQLPNLEKIYFENMADSILPFHAPTFPRAVWSTLKEIRVHFKQNDALRNEPALGKLWKFMFVGVVRENVVELHISFSGFNRKGQVYPRKTRDILTSCPNLKILHVKSTYPLPLDLPQFWRGLPRLEKLRFDGCENLKDEDFIGMDVGKPMFWELKNLKVLEFVGMEGMHVTDDLFSKLVCQMPLKELKLSCCEYGDNVVKSVTLKGIRSLLSGKFASTVERISFEDLRIHGVTHQEIKSLEGSFRSSNMC